MTYEEIITHITEDSYRSKKNPKWERGNGERRYVSERSFYEDLEAYVSTTVSLPDCDSSQEIVKKVMEMATDSSDSFRDRLDFADDLCILVILSYRG